MFFTAAVGSLGCDDPVEGPIGGVVLTIRSQPAIVDSRADQVDRIILTYRSVVAVHRDDADSPARQTVLDRQERTIEIENRRTEIVVAQFQTPIGELLQLRIVPSEVVLHLRDGSVVRLDPEGRGLPSWRRTGWKLTAEGEPILVLEDELVGARASFDFDDRLVPPPPGRSTGSRAAAWKVKPTAPMVSFDVRPPQDSGGVHLDRIDVLVRDGTSRQRFDELAAAIGGEVMLAGHVTPIYRVGLPVTTNLEEAFEHFEAQPEVVVALPAVDLNPLGDANDSGQLDPAENLQRLAMANVPAAWQIAASRDPRGFVGHYGVRVGVIDTGLAYTHRSVAANIGVTQTHVLSLFPHALDQLDCDPAQDEVLGLPGGDGVITIRDLDCIGDDLRPKDATPHVPWLNAYDVLRDPIWTPETPVVDPRTLRENDIVGWRFPEALHFRQNDPFDVGLIEFGKVREPGSVGHGTMVSAVIGAEPEEVDADGNPIGLAGVAWRVSIVPMVAGHEADIRVPFPVLLDAMEYAERRGLHVVNISQGWTVIADEFDLEEDLKCGVLGARLPGEVVNVVQTGVKIDLLRERHESFVEAYRARFPERTRALWVLSAGNSKLDLDDDLIFDFPYSALSRVPAFVDADAGHNALLVVGETGWNEAEGRELATLFRPGFGTNYGAQVQLYAPGGFVAPDFPLHPDLVGTLPGDWPGEEDLFHFEFEGTSAAAPVVAGAAALILAADAGLRDQPDPSELRRRLIDSALHEPDLIRCGDDVRPGLRLDAAAAAHRPEP